MSKFRVLNVVVDSLDVRLFRRASPSWLLARHVPIWRNIVENFEFGDSPTYVQLENLGTFRLKIGGRQPYEFVLINPQICDIRIWNPERWSSKSAAQTGQIYVSFRSVFLQKYGIESARLYLKYITSLFCQIDGNDSMYPADYGSEFDRISLIGFGY